MNILWENISPGTEGNFNIQSEDSVTTYDTKYDYESIMHYSSHAFSRYIKPQVNENIFLLIN